MTISVIGAGIAGCSLALALSKAGKDVEIFEKETETTQASGWLVLSPEAMKIYEQIDYDEIRSVGTECNRLELHRNEDIISVPRNEDGLTSLTVWRKDFIQSLRSKCASLKIPIRYQESLLPAEAKKLSSDDLTVLATGAYSPLRSLFGNSSEVEPGGDSVFYGHTRIAHNLTPKTFYFYDHPSGQYGIYPPNVNECLWYTRENDTYPATIDFSASIRSIREELIDIFVSPINGPIATINLNPNQPWYKEKLIGIGDLVHAISPSAGQGANTAIIDAFVLAKLIRSTSLDEIGEKFEAIRKPSAKHYYHITRKNLTSFLQTPPPIPNLTWKDDY